MKTVPNASGLGFDEIESRTPFSFPIRRKRAASLKKKIGELDERLDVTKDKYDFWFLLAGSLLETKDSDGFFGSMLSLDEIRLVIDCAAECRAKLRFTESLILLRVLELFFGQVMSSPEADKVRHDYTRVLTEQAKSYVLTGEYELARGQLELACENEADTRYKNDFAKRAALNALASLCCYCIGDVDRAIEAKRKQYGILVQDFGDDSADALVCKAEIGDIYGWFGFADTAEKLYEEVLAVAEEKGYDSVTDSCLMKLAECNKNPKGYRRAEELYGRAYSDLSKRHGARSAEATEALMGLIGVNISRGEYENALSLTEQGLADASRNRKCGARLTAELTNLKADILRLNWEHSRALELKEEAYRMVSETYGEYHPFTVRVLCELGVCRYVLADDAAGATDAFRTLASNFAFMYGNDHHYQLRSEEFLDAVENVIANNGRANDGQVYDFLHHGLRVYLHHSAPWSDIRKACCVLSINRIERACKKTYSIFGSHVYRLCR